MKLLIYILGFCTLWFAPERLCAQSNEVQQLLLNAEKLTQFKQILQDMKKGYNLVSSGYNTIKDLSQGNFSLHKTFLDGLMTVNPAIRKYQRVAEIINYQLLLVREYKRAFIRFREAGTFTSAEIAYTGRVYENLFSQSLENLDDLITVITAGNLRMSDDERIREIDRIYMDMQDKISFLRYFNTETSLLSLQRARELNSISTMQGSYGIKP